MDIATLIGLIAGVICLIISILLGGSLLAFFDIPSIFIVIGGGLCSVLISYRIKEVAALMKVAVKTFKNNSKPPFEIIQELVQLSTLARREGLLALESNLEKIEDDFLKNAIQLVIDGTEADIVRESLELELTNLQKRHTKGQGLFKTLAAMFPAWGMIGTLIGLINLLKALDDPTKIGPSMAVALITTFYGSLLANFICTPMAAKLATSSKEEVQLKTLTIEGILSIQAGENPKIMEHKLKTFLSPQDKMIYDEKYRSESKT
ncbi:motility protein A [Pseudobacteroides cellulosolvens]|uniref:MotA/TolQ/ExbB proton channel n=1 Tax=Pseudobacteroides cellulosolvens ATCC 35603 = DSM 2933 TaxID=398512 RepID=A0A0L6JK96_9FIRM|nr:motility protein A [Pseudobacteroides cellulosolvens]KNY26143.1 MotA/TolQ/ExbB proton channel [Pseudobacteroides cellulosolvens ATCC 35603 = DSM 2933]